MIYSLKGNIVEILKDRIAIDLGSIGYEVYVSRPADFLMGEYVTIYTSEILSQDDHYLVGFKDKREKDAFLSLTSVKGVGPKTALSALSATTPDELFAAIASGDAKYLKKLPNIGPKAASQIILDLKGLLVEEPVKVKKADRYPGVIAGLKGLGFKVKEIEPVVNALPDDLDEGVALREALRALKKGNN